MVQVPLINVDMHKLIGLSFFVFVSGLTAQTIGIGGGMSLTNQSDKDALTTYDDNFHQRTGFHFGILAKFKIKGGLSINTNPKYSMWGYTNKLPNTDYTRKLDLRYLNVPVYLEYGFNKYKVRPLLNLGCYFGYGLKGTNTKNGTLNFTKYSNQIDTINWGKRTNDDFRHLDFGYVVGAGIQFSKVQILVQYLGGIRNIASDQDYKQSNKNRGLFIGLNILFNEKSLD